MKKISTLIGIIIIIVVIAVLFGGVFIWQNFQLKMPKNIQTQPGDQTAGWNTLNNAQFGFFLKYPNNFFDPAQNPKILTGDCNYNVFPGKCPDVNNIIINDMIAGGGDPAAIKSNFSNQNYWDNPGGTKQTINNTQFCLYTTGDAATGHAFNYYYFATVKNQKCLVVYMATSTANCDFYLPLEPGNTEQAKNYNNCLTTNKNQPIILKQIINTFKFTK